jgi:citronellol/citronellal dehydrogenase
MADAADVIFVKNSRSFTGNFCVDEDVLNEAGVRNFEKYAVVPGSRPTNDLFVR